MTKQDEKKIQTNYFTIIKEGYRYRHSISFIPTQDGINYQIIDETTTRVVDKGKVE